MPTISHADNPPCVYVLFIIACVDIFGLVLHFPTLIAIVLFSLSLFGLTYCVYAVFNVCNRSGHPCRIMFILLKHLRSGLINE